RAAPCDRGYETAPRVTTRSAVEVVPLTLSGSCLPRKRLKQEFAGLGNAGPHGNRRENDDHELEPSCWPARLRPVAGIRPPSHGDGAAARALLRGRERFVRARLPAGERVDG